MEACALPSAILVLHNELKAKHDILNHVSTPEIEFHT